MTAKELVEKYGEELIGQMILTLPARLSGRMGEYPGGGAKVIAIHPDDAAPEIVCTVRHPRWGEIGVFEYERVHRIH